VEFAEPRLRPRKRKSRVATFLFWTLVFAFYYNWYSYPFKIGSTETSPTYSPTPSWILAIKYPIFLVLCALLLPGIVKNGQRIKIRRPLYFAAYVTLLLFSLFYGMLAETGRFLQVEPFLSQPDIPKRSFDVGIFFVPAIVLHALPPERINFRPILNLLKVTLFIYLAFDLLEVGAFFFFGRLPAQAYENSILVRFGSLMDEPNCFGILTAMFFGLIFASKWRYPYKVLMFVFLSSALLLTLSFTAWAAVAVVCASYALASLSRRVSYRFVLTGLLGVGVLLGSVAFVWNSGGLDSLDTLQELIEAKSESANMHAQSLDTLEKYFNVANVVGLDPGYQGASAESQYVDIALTEGALYLLLFMVVIAAGLYRCVRFLRTEGTCPELRALASTVFCFLIAMVVAGIGLPVMVMFPLNLLMPLMLGICSSGMLEQPAFPGPGGQIALP
jgi:hypothetical protein